MSNKRILIVCQHFWPENFRINDIADFLSDNGTQIDVLCGIPNYPTGKFFTGYSVFKNRRQHRNKIKIERVLEIPRGNNTSIRIAVNYISFPFFSIFHLPRLLFRRYDRVFIYQLSPVFMAFTGIILAKLKKIESVLYVLDLWPENLYSVINVKGNRKRKIISYLSHWHYKNADRLLALSKTMRTNLIAVTGKDPKNVEVLPQTCEKIYETNVKDTKLVAKYKNGFNIVYAGNISPAQSYQTIIEAAKLLTDLNINWIIVGDGMSKKDFKESVEKYNLQSHFHFEGQVPIDRIPRYTYIADALVGCLKKSPLLEATIPAKVVSYMASGKPLILSMDGEVQDLINETSKNGFACDTEDSSNLAKNIRRLYKMTPEEREQMGKRGKEYYLENLERSVVLSKLENFLFR